MLPPVTKLRECNVFTPVCDSVHRGGLCLGGLCPGGSLSRGISVQGGLCGGSLSREVSVQRVSVPRVSVQGEGSLSRGSLSRGSLSRGRSVCLGRYLSRGFSVWGVSVRELPVWLCASGTHTTGMHSC